MNPDDLLAQISDLLQQYVGMGPDTPVAQQAGDLLAAIEATQAGGGQPDAGGGLPPAPDAGGAPPDLGSMMPPPDAGGGDLPPDAGPPPDAPPDDSGGDSFRKARKGAKAFLKSRA
jgi:hypothetical protein